MTKFSIATLWGTFRFEIIGGSMLQVVHNALPLVSFNEKETRLIVQFLNEAYHDETPAYDGAEHDLTELPDKRLYERANVPYGPFLDDRDMDILNSSPKLTDIKDCIPVLEYMVAHHCTIQQAIDAVYPDEPTEDGQDFYARHDSVLTEDIRDLR